MTRLPAPPAARSASRSLAGATQLAHFFTLFLMFTLSALPVMTWTTSQRCDMLHAKMYGRVGADPCTLLLWDLFFASLLPAGTVRSHAPAALASLQMTDLHYIIARQITALQSARRLELSMLLRMARGGRESYGDAAPKPECEAEAATAGGPRITRRAAGLMAAPRAEVIAPPRDSASETPREGLWLNPLFGEAPSGPELRGVLINTGAPTPPAPRISIRIDPAAPQATRLSRKLTR